MVEKLCYCGRNEYFRNCCLPKLQGQKPETAEALMRSRYSAFCTGDIEYLIATHHPSKVKAGERDTLAATIRDTTWLGLKIIMIDNSQDDKGVGVVEFVAFYQSKPPGQLHEKSRFIRELNQWLYLDGTLLPPITIGRNESCWCNSGKKYKKCHGR